MKCKRIMAYLYFLCWLKTPSFNPDSSFRVKLICKIHQKRIKNWIWDTCPWIYDMDDETLNDLIENKKTRNEIVGIELNKYFEKSVNKKSLFIKYERKNDILEMMKRVFGVIYLMLRK